jgi:hypothetical protein
LFAIPAGEHTSASAAHGTPSKAFRSFS